MSAPLVQGTFHYIGLREPISLSSKTLDFNNAEFLVDTLPTSQSLTHPHSALSLLKLGPDTPQEGPEESTPLPRLITTDSDVSDPTPRMKIHVPRRSESITTEADEHPRLTRRLTDGHHVFDDEFFGEDLSIDCLENIRLPISRTQSQCSTAAVTPQVDLIHLPRVPSAVSTMSIPNYIESRELLNPGMEDESRSSTLRSVKGVVRLSAIKEHHERATVLCDRMAARFEKIDGILGELDSRLDKFMSHL